MREIQASEAKTHLPRLLDEVENGESLIITRHGRPIARLIPEPAQGREEVRRAAAAIKARRRQAPAVSAAELLSARDEGRKG
ncbi:prevent-host-death family protein [Paramagnetospirillum marisnigri]|uniref:Antitoxin n=1 Tax=Paramagnetospirillum marisnigri TaxID=1285242 RepID=A0A178MUZ5_9PROT|nr:type II toxin-antitoxin system prevent-host-death family antitoxin [Paramagnetospirillum marisnigri]OAN52892.1 prevent-host-death family protein [Paramagnetospirillum marisnigri]